MGTATHLPARLPVGRLIAHAGIAGTLSILAIGISLGATHTWTDLTALFPVTWNVRDLAIWLTGIALAAAVFSCVWWLARRERPIRPALFLVGLILATILVRVILISMIDPAWSTDYLRYWQRALELASKDKLSITNIYLQRAVFVPYPVAALFGPEASTALKGTNALLLLIVQLIVYDTMRLSSSHQGAQAASITLLASPLPAYAALIPSHDIWAIFFLAVALWTFVRLCFLPGRNGRRIVCIIALTTLCALATYILELQRSMGTILCLTLILVSTAYFLAGRSSTQRATTHPGVILSAALAVLLLQTPLSSFGKYSGIEYVPSSREAAALSMKIAAHGSAMGTARSAWFARFNDRFRQQTSRTPAEIDDFSRSIVLSTWTLQPRGKIDAMREHAERLFSLSYPMDWDTTLRRPSGMSPGVRNALIVHAGIFGLLLLSAILLSVGVYWVRPLEMSWPALIGAVFILGLSSLLLLLFENKPYNIAPVWMIYPMILGGILASKGRHQRDHRIPTQSAIGLGSAGVTLTLASALGAWLLLRAMYGINDGQVLDRWQFDLQSRNIPVRGWQLALQNSAPRAFEPRHYVHDTRSFVLRDADEDGERIGKRADRLFLALRFPDGPISSGDRLVAARQVCLYGERKKLEFFMFAPYLRQSVHNVFELEVSMDGLVVGRAPIPHTSRKDSMRLVTAPLTTDTDGPCHTLSISLISNVDRTAPSWPAASYVELWFPRLAM